MKKFFTLAVVAVMALGASAQNWYVGGSLGFNKTTTTSYTEDDEIEIATKSKTTTISIAPEIGYNFNETWAAGATIGFSHISNKPYKTTTFEIAPYARYTYFRAGVISLFVDGGVSFATGKTKVDLGDEAEASSKSISTYGIGLKPGVAFNVSEKFGFIAHMGFLGYEGANKAAKNAGIPEKVGLSLTGDDLSFGFYYNF